MTYETAKKLKDAGYSQEDPRMTPITLTNENVNEFLFKAKGDCYIPTLSELIDACGDEFLYLARQEPHPAFHKFGFSAYSTNPEEYKDVAYGKTATEAVAHLWLALNDKKQ